MKLLRTFTMIALLGASTATAFADTAPPKKDAKTEEISAADADKFLAFFNKFVDAIVQNKDNCPKMASSLNGVIDGNKDLIQKANDAKASGKKLPKALEEKMMARVKEMMPAMQKCGADKDVQAAIQRMDKKDDAAPVKKEAPTEKPPTKK
ncbi:MAG: hypothetical protein H6Q90_2900 [Deltaproteobacteria bacterium]|nr:hypothetical protein [Deltaproteobacteria bacterium]